MRTALKIDVRGRVQGVGFRPFVFQLANRYELTGTVQNNMDGVKIHLEGEERYLQLFLSDLKNSSPRLSRINKIETFTTAMKNFNEFTIIESERSGKSMLVIPVDSAVCQDCLDEMNDPNNFRYHYPFINCTQCGPRYTIIEQLPYDRHFTSMREFSMCPDCQKEYDDPTNRRHHAQPIACPKCGPQIRLLDANGMESRSEDPLLDTIEHLKAGRIVAVKGLGGYHLCCDAENEDAVKELRKRKNRPERPLAVMASTVDAVHRFAETNEAELNLLTSPESPIVILKKSSSFRLADNVSPKMSTIGVMLPYTPLHHLLFQLGKLSCLVMTSANPSGQPITYKDDDAFKYLDGIADFYLMHNRDILHPVDDSVIQINSGKTDFLRRSRGYVPDPFFTSKNVSGIIAFGGQQKTTFSIGRNEQVFLGPHIGELENIETITHYQNELDHLLKWVDTPKSLAVIDAHPGYYSRKLVNDYEFANVLEVQHHHVHMAACMEEHQLSDPVFGIILDGTGYGLDGNVWGFEIFHGDAFEFDRLAHLQYTPLPGNEKCIREPWRNAASMLMALCGEEGNRLAKAIFKEKSTEIDILKAMIEKNINTVQAGTCGRLFDAVSALCGVTTVSTYDGEAAIRLAELVNEEAILPPYPFHFEKKNEQILFNFSEMIKEIAKEVLRIESISTISGRFHETIVQSITSAMVQLSAKRSDAARKVVFSGGSFHNRYLRKRLIEELEKKEFEVFVPEKIPCSDGGLSYGQLVVAEAKRRSLACVLESQQE